MEENGEATAAVEASALARDGLDQERMLGDGENMCALGLPVPTGDAGKPVGDVRDFDVERWSEWNPGIWRSRVRGGELHEGATLAWTFNAIRPAYPYKLPARAQIVEFEPRDRVTWEVSAPGFHPARATISVRGSRRQSP